MAEKKQRDSNIELLRIVLMIAIILHHYIVNSGITELINDSVVESWRWNSCVALILGWGGKTAINCFVLITGYFMCKQEYKWQKILHLYLEVKFYSIVIYLIFLISGYETFTLKGFYKTMFGVVLSFDKGFIGSFIAFYALIPFINKLISVLDKKSHGILAILLCIIFSIVPTLFLNTVFEYISWYTTLYIIASYIRLYPNKIFDNKRLTGLFLLGSLIVSWLTIILIYYCETKIGRVLPHYWFVADSNKILAFVTSLFAFSFFIKISLGQNKFVNTISSATFGVLLIHDSGDSMRKWLWQDVCNNVWHFKNDSLLRFIAHAFLCTLCIYSICVVINLVLKFLQKIIKNN